MPDITVLLYLKISFTRFRSSLKQITIIREFTLSMLNIIQSNLSDLKKHFFRKENLKWLLSEKCNDL